MSTDVVVDTDVVSYLFKQSPHSEPYVELVRTVAPVISFMTVAELDSWVLQRDWGIQRRTALERFLRRYAIYGSDRQLCQRWAEVTEMGRKAGQPINCADAWIAATALELDCPLITNNVRDYRMIPGLAIRSAAGE